MSPGTTNTDATSAAPHITVEVERSGGFAGLTRTWTADSADLAADDADRLRTLVDATNSDPRADDPRPTGRPDGFQYDITVVQGEQLWKTTVPEKDLDQSLRALIDHVRGVVAPS